MPFTPEQETYLRQIVRSELRRLLGEAEADDTPDWLDTAGAYKKLGYPSAKSLREDVNAGLLRLSDGRVEREVRDRRKPGSKHARLQFHIANCQKRLNECPDRRRVG